MPLNLLSLHVGDYAHFEYKPSLTKPQYVSKNAQIVEIEADWIKLKFMETGGAAFVRKSSIRRVSKFEYVPMQSLFAGEGA